MSRFIDEQMPDIVRSEYGMWPASAEPFRRDDGATGILVASRGRQTGTAALKACSGSMFSPAGAEKEYTFLKAAGERRSEAVCNPCCNGARGYDRDDCKTDGYTDVVLRSIWYDLNKEDGMGILVASDLRGIITVKISEKHPMAKFFQKKMNFLLYLYIFSTADLSRSFRHVIVNGKSTQTGTENFFLKGGHS